MFIILYKRTRVIVFILNKKWAEIGHLNADGEKESRENRLENSFPTCLSSSVKPKERSWGTGSNEVYRKCGLDFEKHYH